MTMTIQRLIALVAVLVLASVAQAQTARGTILGTARDPSGAVLPGVKVTVTNEATNISYEFITDADGNYLVSSLLPGTYRVTAELAGFKKTTVTGVVLQVEQKARVDLSLEVGPVSETIEVTGGPVLVHTDAATIGQVVSNRQIVDLPLVSRNFTQLLLLTPGVIQPVGGIQAALRTDQAGGAFSIAGARVSSNSYLIDGVVNNDPLFQTPALTPSVDAIQEFKVQSGQYSAEFGQGYGQINISIKSGTNQLHGSVHEFLRNDALQPHLPGGTFKHPLTGGPLKNPLKYNQFGFAAGGPIILPGIYRGKDRTFFFGNYEGRRQRTGSIATGILPTEAMRRGDFSALGKTIYDPATTRPDPNNPGRFIRDPFPNNIIPSSRINPLSQKIVSQFFPQPNLATPIGPNNYATLIRPENNLDQFNIRLDHQIAGKHNLFGRFSLSNQEVPNPSLMPLSGSKDVQRGRNFGLQYNHVFTPRMLNEVRLGYSRAFYVRGFETALSATHPGKELGFKNLTDRPFDTALPLFSLTGYTALGFGGSVPISIANIYQVVDHFSLISGAHALKMGLDIRHNRVRSQDDFRANGHLFFFGNYTAQPSVSGTGDAFADFLLGLPQQVFINNAPTGTGATNNAFHFFVQDDWRVTPRLTLNLGLRYEYRQPFLEEDLGGAYFDFNFPGGRAFVANRAWAERVNQPRFACCAPPRVVDPDRNDWAPRLGFAWRPFGNNKTAVRGGYGLFYDAVSDFYFLQLYGKRLTIVSPPGITGDPITPPVNLQDLFPAPVDLASFPTTQVGGSFLEKRQRTPYTQNWSLNIQRELPWNAAMEVGYVGTKGTKLPHFFMFNQADANPNPQSNPQTRVPYRNFTSFAFVVANQLNLIYHALQVKVDKRFSQGLLLLASYTYSSNIDYGSEIFAFGGTFNITQNSHNLRAERGRASTDFPHRFVLSYVYELPFGQGKALLSSGALGKILGGWQVNGIVTLQSGPPFSIWALAGDTSNSGGLSAYERSDLVGNPLPSGFRRNQLSQFERGGTLFWFDGTAFRVPAFGTFGNTGRNILRGTHTRLMDFSVLKNTRIGEQVNVQFRAEFFNIFSERLYVGRLPQGFFANVRSTLGRMGTRDELFNPRVIQFALKLIF